MSTTEEQAVARAEARDKARLNARDTGIGGQGYRRMFHGKRGPQGKDRR